METQSTTPRLKEFGTWTEQTSSSGKRYYYNSASNVSQWDKPAEWKQAEKMRSSTSSSSSAAKNGGSGRTPTKFPSSSPFYNSSDQKGVKHHQQQQSLLLTGTSKPRPLNSINTSALALTALKDQQQHQRHQFTTGVGVTNGKTSSSTPTSTVASTADVKQSDDKHSTNEGFREDKYQRNWRPEMSAHRRTIGIDVFMHEVKKHTERATKQMTSIFALDRDIHSIQTLDRTALLRTRLLQQRLGAVRQRVQELDSKGQ